MGRGRGGLGGGPRGRLRELQEQERIDADRAAEWNRHFDVTRADLEFAEKEPITRRGGVVLAWAGMRGVVTLAAAQSIDVHINGAPTPYRSTIILVAFVVAVASLLIFGGTLPWVIRRLNFKAPSPTDQRAELFALMSDLGAEAADVVVDEALAKLDSGLHTSFKLKMGALDPADDVDRVLGVAEKFKLSLAGLRARYHLRCSSKTSFMRLVR